MWNPHVDKIFHDLGDVYRHLGTRYALFVFRGAERMLLLVEPCIAWPLEVSQGRQLVARR